MSGPTHVSGEGYVSPQELANRKIVEKLNNPKQRKLTPKQAKEKETKDLHAKLGGMSKEDKHAFATKHGVDPSKYSNDWNLHSEILRTPSARQELLNKE